MEPVVNDAGAPQRVGTASSTDRERIAERAYELYIQRGGSDGRDLDDWLEAERQLARRGHDNSATADSGA